MTSENSNQLDQTSDRLIGILIDRDKSSNERARASRELYQRHAAWVIQQVGNRVYNEDDIQDIAQSVWMFVLHPGKLEREYKNHHGKFRAFMRAPIRWCILKHLEKLPFAIDEHGEKCPIKFVDIDETMLEECLDKHVADDVIERIIKPNLKTLKTSVRNVYVVNEYETIFETDPSVTEVAKINGMADKEANGLLKSASAKTVQSCSDDELAVYLPVEYRQLVDPVKIKQSSGRYLAHLMGISERAFRKRLHSARRFLIDIVRKNLDAVTSHG